MPGYHVGDPNVCRCRSRKGYFLVTSVILAFGGLVSGSAVPDGDNDAEDRTQNLWIRCSVASWYVGQKVKKKYICSLLYPSLFPSASSPKSSYSVSRKDTETNIESCLFTSSQPSNLCLHIYFHLHHPEIPNLHPTFSQYHPQQCKLKHPWAAAATTASLLLSSAAEATTATSKPAASVAPAIPPVWLCALLIASLLMMAEVDITKAT